MYKLRFDNFLLNEDDDDDDDDRNLIVKTALHSMQRGKNASTI